MKVIFKKLLPLIIFFILVVVFTIYNVNNDYRVLLRYFGVPAEKVLFYDLWQVIYGAQLITNKRLMNQGDEIFSEAWYPFGLLNLDYINLYGIILIILYIYSAYKVSTLLQSSYLAPKLYFSLLLISYVSIFAMERGQADLIIFVLIFLAIEFHSKKLLALSIILYTCLIKFYTIGLVAIFWSKNLKNSLITTTLFIGLFSAYIITYWDTFSFILNLQSSAFKGITWKSYGAQNIINLLSSSSYGGYINSINNLNFLPIGIGLLSFLIISNLKRINYNCQSNNKNQNLFLAGAIIYMTTFLIGRNFDYKLITLLFCIPHLWELKDEKSSFVIYIVTNFALIAIFFLFWSGLFGGDLLESIRDENLDSTSGKLLRFYLNGFNLLKEIISWLLYLSMGYLTIQLLPLWFGQTLNLSIFRTK